MSLFKPFLLILFMALLVLIDLPFLIMLFASRAKNPLKRATAGIVILVILAAILLGGILWSATDLLRHSQTPTSETTSAATEVSTIPATAPTVAETEPQEIGATISTEQLDGQWIAISEPEVPEDENYTYVANGGYYNFQLDGTFTYTQLQLAKAGTWKALPGRRNYSGTYILEGDVLTLHYQTFSLRTEEEYLEQNLDETDIITMRINQSCTEMCVLTPDHPKLGKLFLFQRGRGSDPVTALLVALNAAY